MKSVLVGTDFMYKQDGSLVPIEINTNVGLDWYNRNQSFSEMLDLSALKSFLEQAKLTAVYLEGNLFEGNRIGLVAEIEAQLGKDITIYLDADKGKFDEDSVFIIRSSYSETAAVDSYAAHKLKFRDLVKDEKFGLEYRSQDVNILTAVGDNGAYPNFVLKADTPAYDKLVYPKFYKLGTLKKANNLELPDGFFLEPFLYNSSKALHKGEVLKLVRNWTIFVQEEDGLKAIPLGSYERRANELMPEDNEIVYSKVGELKSSRDCFVVNTDNGTVTFTNWKRTVLAFPEDEIQMADGTWKPVSELEVGEFVNSLYIPVSGNSVVSHEQDYNVDYDTFVSGARFESASVRGVWNVTGSDSLNNCKLTFSDGTEIVDMAESSYLGIDPEDGSVRFRKIARMLTGDKIILLESGSFVTKTLKAVEVNVVPGSEGYGLTLDSPNIFFTRVQGSSPVVSIEHNETIIGDFGDIDLLKRCVLKNILTDPQTCDLQKSCTNSVRNTTVCFLAKSKRGAYAGESATASLSLNFKHTQSGTSVNFTANNINVFAGPTFGTTVSEFCKSAFNSQNVWDVTASVTLEYEPVDTITAPVLELGSLTSTAISLTSSETDIVPGTNSVRGTGKWYATASYGTVDIMLTLE